MNMNNAWITRIDIWYCCTWWQHETRHSSPLRPHHRDEDEGRRSAAPESQVPTHSYATTKMTMMWSPSTSDTETRICNRSPSFLPSFLTDHNNSSRPDSRNRPTGFALQKCNPRLADERETRVVNVVLNRRHLWRSDCALSPSGTLQELQFERSNCSIHSSLRNQSNTSARTLCETISFLFSRFCKFE